MLKMAPKMAVIQFPNFFGQIGPTYLTKKRNKKHFNVDFVWLFRV